MPPPIDTGNEEYQKEAQVKRDKFEKEVYFFCICICSKEQFFKIFFFFLEISI